MHLRLVNQIIQYYTVKVKNANMIIMNNNDIKVVTGHARGEITEKKSRFIANVFEIHSEDEAADILASVKKKYYDARHNCHAFILGGKNPLQRFSDDGEPSGTAGKPILEVISRQGYQNILIVVTRYFGGILLGTGGLSRAYSQAAQEGLADACDKGLVSPLYEGITLTLSCDYSLLGRIQYTAAQSGVMITDTEYAGDVTFRMIAPAEVSDPFIKKITEATNAASVINTGEPVSYIIKKGKPVIYSL